MWPSSPSDMENQFPRRRPGVVPDSASSFTRRSSTTSGFEERRRDLPPPFVQPTDLWTFHGSMKEDPATFRACASGTQAQSSSGSEKLSASLSSFEPSVKTVTHGVIGSYAPGKATTRMLWNRPEREDEEREEEALPSYLSYLQAPSFTGDVAAPAVPTSACVRPMTTLGRSRDHEMEEKTHELARALQNFISVQMQGQEPASPSSTIAGGCNCERRVAELEKQVEALVAARKEEKTGAAARVSGHALSDRVSTLEGRQGAFQSQLAQISKVLGLPVGKPPKSSQLKTLVQSLHDEINTKIQSAVAEMEAACAARATTRENGQRIGEAAASAPASVFDESTPALKTQQQICTERESVPSSDLPFSALLNALAEEHEASLTKLSTHVEERLQVEASQRMAFEGRVQARLGELEEWLQQVEGELGPSHFNAAPSTSLAAMTEEITRLPAQLAAHQDLWQQVHQHVRALAAQLSTVEDFRVQVTQQHGVVQTLGEKVDAALARSTRAEETLAVTCLTQGLKLIVETLVRDTGSAEQLVQHYVRTMTHHVARVTRPHVSLRMQDKTHRLLDARVPTASVLTKERESFLSVRGEKENDGPECWEDAHRGFGLDESEATAN
ncbi:hypothetical protein PsorP6_010461 [Peronosclerospora sorghi]|uniref:Uncharacterized protein n=1 Tax=Peronosclerospora sorghi TaxID=230839 RepID=A0ACC0VW94_9STRA|nr:hypothetical protein PsorP6_010461 [Peronosclerospora sorghi]